MHSRVPATLDRYQLVAPIGRGGMAEVFHARLQRIGGFERDVAVKVLLPEFSSEPEFVEMLLDEARIAGAIGHPCVVQVIDVGRHDDLFYLVMEYVDGSDLRSILRAAPGGKLGCAAALHLVAEVLRGLHAVHTATDRGGVPRRIVHRDVSPANVMVDRSGAVKLGDFGIAHASHRLTRTRNGAVKGKLRYMAPEQWSGAVVDHRADVYAAAMVLCEALLGDAGCEPRSQTPYGPVFAWSAAAAARLPADVAALLGRALASRPSARFADAAAFRGAVVEALARRAPGYGAEELARDLAAHREGFLEDAPTIASAP
jgi:serine/threonine-protein kinase